MSMSFNKILTLEEAQETNAAALNMQSVAAILGVDPRTVRAGISNGSIPSIQVGRRVLIPRKKFLKMFDLDDD